MLTFSSSFEYLTPEWPWKTSPCVLSEYWSNYVAKQSQRGHEEFKQSNTTISRTGNSCSFEGDSQNLCFLKICFLNPINGKLESQFLWSFTQNMHSMVQPVLTLSLNHIFLKSRTISRTSLWTGPHRKRYWNIEQYSSFSLLSISQAFKFRFSLGHSSHASRTTPSRPRLWRAHNYYLEGNPSPFSSSRCWRLAASRWIDWYYSPRNCPRYKSLPTHPCHTVTNGRLDTAPTRMVRQHWRF